MEPVPRQKQQATIGWKSQRNESGEDYLYPEEYFVFVTLPRAAEGVWRRSHGLTERPQSATPHGWDAGLFFDETDRVLLRSDLFFHPGDPEPLTTGDVDAVNVERVLGAAATISCIDGRSLPARNT